MSRSPFPRYLPRLDTTVAEALGVLHPRLGDRRRYVLGLCPKDEFELVPPPCIVRYQRLPTHDGRPVPERIILDAIEWFLGVLAEDPRALVIVHCLMGAQRSSTTAYAILRLALGLDHRDALQRVSVRAHRAADVRWWPSDDILSPTKALCDRLDAIASMARTTTPQLPKDSR